MKTSFLPAGVALATCAAGLLIPFGPPTAAPSGRHRSSTPHARTQRRPRGVAGREVLHQAARVSTPHRLASSHRAGPRRRGHSPGRHRAAVAGARRLQRARSTARTTRCAASATRSRSGSPTTLAFPAGDCRAQVATSTDVTEAQVDRLISEFDNNMYPKETTHLQHAAGPRRHQRPARPRRQRQRRRLHRRRRQDGRADRQRPRRQLLRLPGGPDVHRRLLLVAVQRAARPQRDDDRRLRLGAPHRRQPAGRARPPTRAPAARRARTSTRAPSPTSGSTCCTTTPTRSRRPGSTRASPTSPRRWSGTSTPPRPSTSPAPTATSTASRASAPCRRRTTPTRATAAAPRTR